METDDGVDVVPAGTYVGKLVQVFALVSLAAGVGYNFRQISETKEWQEKYDKEFVRRDVNEQQLQSINYQLVELRGQLIELKTIMAHK
jgi:hypothetical protein